MVCAGTRAVQLGEWSGLPRSFSGIVDLLSIAPILVICFDLPASFGFVRFLRVFRVVRVLRLHRLLLAQVSAVCRTYTYIYIYEYMSGTQTSQSGTPS